MGTSVSPWKVATPEQVQDVHSKIRGWLADHVSPVGSAWRTITRLPLNLLRLLRASV